MLMYENPSKEAAKRFFRACLTQAPNKTHIMNLLAFYVDGDVHEQIAAHYDAIVALVRDIAAAFAEHRALQP